MTEGCPFITFNDATFTQRAFAVLPAIEYLNEFCEGKDVDNIEDMWQSAYVSS